MCDVVALEGGTDDGRYRPSVIGHQCCLRPGIAEGDLPRVFDWFYRSAEARDMPGSGLGLSTVAQVAQRHDGSVRAARNEAGGARVLLHLPGSPQESGLVVGAVGHDQP